MRLVLDTNIVVSGLRSPSGASAELLRRLRMRRVVLLLSVPLVVEYEAVASEERNLTAAGLDVTAIATVIDVLVAVAEPVEIRFLWRPQLRDPADEMVLETAANGRADAIVTFNSRDFAPASTMFRIELLTSQQALKRIGP